MLTVSFIIPFDAKAGFLPDVVRSVLRQYVPDVELVIVHEGEEQDVLGTLGILRETHVFIASGKKVKVLLARGTRA